MTRRKGDARATRGEPGRRQGTPSAFDEAATDLRLVGIERGSAILVLEAPPLEEPLGVEHLAAATFDGLLQDLEHEAVPSDVIDAFERARAARRRCRDRPTAAGADRPWTEPAWTRCDGPPARSPSAGAGDRAPARARSGPHPDRHPLRRCRVGLLLPRGDGAEGHRGDQPHGRRHRARERGGPLPGRIALEELGVVPEAVQGALFEWAPPSLEELRTAQGDPGRGGSIIPAEASDEEAERFLAALEEL